MKSPSFIYVIIYKSILISIIMLAVLLLWIFFYIAFKLTQNFKFGKYFRAIKNFIFHGIYFDIPL